jgi:hypothetical protein
VVLALICSAVEGLVLSNFVRAPELLLSASEAKERREDEVLL